MCFGIRFSNPFHLATKIISVQNPNCLKNAKNAWADMIFILAFRSEAWAVLSLHNYIYLIHVITLNSQNITDFKSKQLMKMADDMDLECIPHLWKRIPHLWKRFLIYGRAIHIHLKPLKHHVRACLFAFLWQFGFWMDIILVARWNGLENLILKHMWKSKIWLLEQK